MRRFRGLPLAAAHVTGKFGFAPLFENPRFVLGVFEYADTRGIEVDGNALFGECLDFHGEFYDFHVNVIGAIGCVNLLRVFLTQGGKFVFGRAALWAKVGGVITFMQVAAYGTFPQHRFSLLFSQLFSKTRNP
jgi:hypothetical protein